MENNNFNLEVYGDRGYQYKGRINSFEGNIPHLLIPLRGDNQLFVHINVIRDMDVFDEVTGSKEVYIIYSSSKKISKYRDKIGK